MVAQGRYEKIWIRLYGNEGLKHGLKAFFEFLNFGDEGKVLRQKGGNFLNYFGFSKSLCEKNFQYSRFEKYKLAIFIQESFRQISELLKITYLHFSASITNSNFRPHCKFPKQQVESF